MNVLVNVHICALREKPAPLFRKRTAKCTQLASYQIHECQRRCQEDANENKQGRCYYCRKGKNNISVHLDLTKRHYLLLKDFYNKVEDEGSIDFLCADINF